MKDSYYPGRRRWGLPFVKLFVLSMSTHASLLSVFGVAGGFMTASVIL
jgi:hypothetical protein